MTHLEKIEIIEKLQKELFTDICREIDFWYKDSPDAEDTILRVNVREAFEPNFGLMRFRLQQHIDKQISVYDKKNINKT